jgi:hypothetical protein
LDDAKIKKLATMLFDPAAKEGERGNAVAMIARLTKEDRDQLVDALLSGLNGDAGKKRSADLSEELSRRILEVVNLEWEVSRLKMQVSTLTADRQNARASRDYVMAERDRLVAERDRVLALFRHVEAERNRLDRVVLHHKAERDHLRRERQQPSNLPEIKCAAPGCANVFRPRRRNHKTCSDACRQALSRTAQAAIQ